MAIKYDRLKVRLKDVNLARGKNYPDTITFVMAEDGDAHKVLKEALDNAWGKDVVKKLNRVRPVDPVAIPYFEGLCHADKNVKFSIKFNEEKPPIIYVLDNGKIVPEKDGKFLYNDQGIATIIIGSPKEKGELSKRSHFIKLDSFFRQSRTAEGSREEDVEFYTKESSDANLSEF